jgi:GAF domain-containing protein
VTVPRSRNIPRWGGGGPRRTSASNDLPRWISWSLAEQITFGSGHRGRPPPPVRIDSYLWPTTGGLGPCLDAYRTRAPVINADLGQGGARWPLFAPRATRIGFRSVHAMPLRLRTTVIGALNLFGGDTGALGPDDVRVVQALADVATIGLLQDAPSIAVRSSPNSCKGR